MTLRKINTQPLRVNMVTKNTLTPLHDNVSPVFAPAVIERLDPAKLYYLATPYTRYPFGLAAAHRHACMLAAQLIEERFAVFSPIAHGHEISIHGGLDPRDGRRWEPFNLKMLAHCDAMIVAELRGWSESTGIYTEISECHLLGKPVVFMKVEGA